MTEKQWIDLIAGDAQKAANLYGYLPSVLIAQTCQETGYGRTDLSQEGIYNTVGMKKELLNSTWKSMYWLGDTYTKKTPEWYGGKKAYITDVFRVYPSYFDGLADYCQFMHDARYSVGGEFKYRDLLGETDPWTLIEGVRSRGYCTDPNYSTAIMKIIKKHNLTQYDGGEKFMKYTIKDITSENTAPRSRDGYSIDWIVVHYLGVPNADNPYLYGGGYGGHYYVSRAGEIYKAVDPREGVVWHCGGGLQGSGGHAYYGICKNFNSIGIECGVCADTSSHDLSGDSDLWYFTTETQDACAWLVSQLMEEYDIALDHVIRHYDVTGKICPNPYVLNNKRNTSWTWDEFKLRVASYHLNGGASFEPTELTPEQRVVATGQRHSVNYTGHVIDCDGVYGKESRKNAIRCLQRAANVDWNAGLSVDGVIGAKTRKAFEGHFIKRGECQDMVTAVEIIMYMRGRNPNGVEVPGVFGAGLAKALGTEYITGAEILKLVD